jgi:hypothetical protein
MATQSQAAKPETGTPFIAEIADMLFATKTIEKIGKGEGNWGDLAMLGITAASFVVLPAKLTMLPVKALNAVIRASEKAVKSEKISVAARNAAAKTLDNALTIKRQGYVPTGTEPVERVGKSVPFEPEGKLSDKYNYELGDKKYVSDSPGARSRYDEESYDGFSNIEDPYPRQITPDSVRNLGKPKPALDKPFAADQPDMVTSELVDQINKLYKFKKNMSDAAFNTQRARILVQLFPEKELLPDVADISRSAGELITSSGSITNAKKKEIIKGLKASDNPDDVRLAKELEDLDLKTLKQEVDVAPGKSKKDPQKITTKEVPSETTSARSALQPELDDVLYEKELAENMLKTTDDPDAIFKLERKIKSLDKRATDLQKYIDEPYSSGAIDQTKKTIPSKRRGRETVEYKSPRSYTARESVKRSGKAPDGPKRSTLSELKSDEETILKQLKTAQPGQRKALQADLARTRQEIMNVEVGRLRQSLDDQVKNIPAASKSVESLTLRELESELTRLRSAHKKLSKFKSKQAEEALEEITARGKAVRELLDEAKKRSGKPASDMADIKGKAKPDKGEKSSRLKITEDNIDLLVEAERDALIDGDFTEYNELVKQLMRDQ